MGARMMSQKLGAPSGSSSEDVIYHRLYSTRSAGIVTFCVEGTRECSFAVLELAYASLYFFLLLLLTDHFWFNCEM